MNVKEVKYFAIDVPGERFEFWELVRFMKRAKWESFTIYNFDGYTADKVRVLFYSKKSAVKAWGYYNLK